MRERLPLLVTLAGIAVLFLAMAFVATLVVASLFLGTALDFVGGNEVGEALARRG